MTRARKFDRHSHGERDAFAVCLFAEWETYSLEDARYAAP